MLLEDAGYEVISAVGAEEISRCEMTADLLILAHSVPVEHKLQALAIFRKISEKPVLSLLRPNQSRLPQVDFAVEAFHPHEFVSAVTRVLREARNR